MSWASHISKLSTIAIKKWGILKAIGIKIPRRTKEQQYKTFILPNLEYGNVIFSPADFIYLNKLNKIQRNAVLVCTGAYNNTENTKSLRELGWETLEIRTNIHKMFLFYNFLAWTFLHTWSLYNRLGKTVIEPLVKLGTPLTIKSFEKLFFPSMVSKWNKLEAGIKHSRRLRIFKHQVRSKKSGPDPSTPELSWSWLYSSLQIASGIECA